MSDTVSPITDFWPAETAPGPDANRLTGGTFAQVVCSYSSVSGRCICGSTISLMVNGEWAHGHREADGTRSVWCPKYRL